jgi:hypothetical protein
VAAPGQEGAAPVLIWTLRRTGGTALASLLSALSPRPSRQHEPFNRDRVHGDVTRAFADSGDRAALRAGVARALADRPVIKHCFDILPKPLHAALLDVAGDLGYAHLVLDRREESARVLSLELARRTGIWGAAEARRRYPEFLDGDRQVAPLPLAPALSALREGRARRDWLAAEMAARGIRPRVVFFEEVFGPGVDGRARILRLLADLGLDPGAVADGEDRLRVTLEERAQGSERLLARVPNIADLRAALAAETGWRNPFDAAAFAPGNGPAAAGIAPSSGPAAPDS